MRLRATWQSFIVEYLKQLRISISFYITRIVVYDNETWRRDRVTLVVCVTIWFHFAIWRSSLISKSKLSVVPNPSSLRFNNNYSDQRTKNSNQVIKDNSSNNQDRNIYNKYITCYNRCWINSICLILFNKLQLVYPIQCINDSLVLLLKKLHAWLNWMTVPRHSNIFVSSKPVVGDRHHNSFIERSCGVGRAQLLILWSSGQ